MSWATALKVPQVLGKSSESVKELTEGLGKVEETVRGNEKF